MSLSNGGPSLPRYQVLGSWQLPLPSKCLVDVSYAHTYPLHTCSVVC